MSHPDPFALVAQFLARQQQQREARKQGRPHPDPVRYVTKEQAPKKGQYGDKPCRWFIGKTVKLGLPTGTGTTEHIWFDHVRLARDGHLRGVLANIPVGLPFTCGETKVGFDPEDVEEVLAPAPRHPRRPAQEAACPAARSARPGPRPHGAPRYNDDEPATYPPAPWDPPTPWRP